MNETSNFHLPQFEASDRIHHDDFNAAFEKIDTAVAAKGNCRIAYGSYTGSGQYGSSHPNTLDLGFEPKLVIVAEASSGLAPYGYSTYWSCSFIWTPGMDYVFVATNGTGWCSVAATESTLTWYSTESDAHQLNLENTSYFYIALGE